MGCQVQQVQCWYSQCVGWGSPRGQSAVVRNAFSHVIAIFVMSWFGGNSTAQHFCVNVRLLSETYGALLATQAVCLSQRFLCTLGHIAAARAHWALIEASE